MKNYIKTETPYRVPTQDNKIIEEFLGLASTGEPNYSIAHMIAPPLWSEPWQKPEFDEVTVMIRGRKLVELDGEKIELKAGETILIKKGTRVRYSNPFPEPNEYWSFCIPAFTIETVRREENN
jgi:mannose-6-phosphate isomerase-like protein (cupin superfamily)